jgi:hypothetical protein
MNRIRTIDGWRDIAIAMVQSDHIQNASCVPWIAFYFIVRAEMIWGLRGGRDFVPRSQSPESQGV